MSTITHRYEILFIYEAKDCNPNGDPLDENRPRTDPETGEATVSDVRIKRTVRDYFLSLEPDVEKRLASGREVLVRDTLKLDGHLSEGKDRAEQFLTDAAKSKKGEDPYQAIKTAILQGCIDARLFGATLPLASKKEKKEKKQETPQAGSTSSKKSNRSSLQLTGPVQFSAFNRSLHRVSPTFVRQTAAYAGGSTDNQKSFAERWLLPYALIAAYGVANEIAAQTTGLKEEDFKLLLQGLWQGTAALNTHSKLGHDPLLLVVAQYEPGYRLGALPRRISLNRNQGIEDTALRSTRDFYLEVGELLTAWSHYPQLTGLQVKQDDRLRCQVGDKTGLFAALAEQLELPVTALDF